MLYNYKMYNANVLQNYSVTILLPILIYQVNGITKRTLFFFPPLFSSPSELDQQYVNYVFR